MSNFRQGDFDIVKEGGAGFKRFREENNISLDAIANLSGLSADTLRAVEAGEHPINMRIAWAYCEAHFHSSIGELCGLEPEQVRQECKSVQVQDVRGHIGALLRDIREQHGSALHQVATRFGVSPMALDKVELGRTVPGERMFAIYRELLGEVFAEPPLPPEAREFLVFIRAGIARLSRAEFAKRAGVLHNAVWRIEIGGQYQPGDLVPYREALAQFKRASVQQRYLFPHELIELRKKGRVPLWMVGDMLGISESGVSHMERRRRQKPLSAKEVWAYYESARRLGAVSDEDDIHDPATIPLRIQHWPKPRGRAPVAGKNGNGSRSQ